MIAEQETSVAGMRQLGRKGHRLKQGEVPGHQHHSRAGMEFAFYSGYIGKQ